MGKRFEMAPHGARRIFANNQDLANILSGMVFWIPDFQSVRFPDFQIGGPMDGHQSSAGQHQTLSKVIVGPRDFEADHDKAD